MTDDSILQKYIDEQESSIGNQSEYADGDEQKNPASFGWLRGIRDRALMLELRKKNGNIMAFGYSWLERVEFDPSEGIMLVFGEQSIFIKGRNLNAESRPQVKLFEGLLRHRVPWIQESDMNRKLHFNKCDTVIDAIEW